jgi:hypothetical protein
VTREDLICAYADWLSSFEWIFFGTLTFREPEISLRKANQLFDRWIHEIEAAEGTKDFRWVRVAERGAFGDNLHFHCLVGGLRNGSKWNWLLRWKEMAGEAFISYYFRGGGATRYMLKTLRPGHDFEIELHLPPPATANKALSKIKRRHRNDGHA